MLGLTSDANIGKSCTQWWLAENGISLANPQRKESRMSTSAAYAPEPISHGSSYGAPQAPPAPQFSIVTGEQEIRPDAGERGQEVYRMANQLFQQNPDWVTFF